MKVYKNHIRLNRELKKYPDKNIVFTNGVFDIIHPGHIELFQFAKSKGDLLIVGINDDDSVRRLKGEKRPIFNLDDRIEVLAAIEYIDFITVFSEDTPLQLINNLPKIHFLIKGGDYSPSQVVGKKKIENSGGELHIFKLSPAYSTTMIIDKIRSAK
jgi:rfaE bifunctional protein nucleotidyltransferase chain/domain